MKNKLYSLKILKDLYHRAKDEQAMKDQWLEIGDLQFAYKSQIKMETLVELMENIYCFHVGLGAVSTGSSHCTLLDSRLDSFCKVLKV